MAGVLKSREEGLSTQKVSKECRRRLRIGLLRPYGGTNLGDSAIQTAAIEEIRRRLSEAKLWGNTPNAAETTKRHGIPAFPIAGLLVRFYSETLFAPIRGLSIKFQTKSGSTR